MKSLEDQMAFYAAYHQDARNKATHFVGVPLIMLSLFIPLAWLRVDLGAVTLSAAMIFAAVVLVYYLLLDLPLGFAMVLITCVLVVFFALGYKPRLHAAVQERALRLRSSTPEARLTATG